MKVLFLTTSYPTSENPVAGVFVKEHARAAAVGAEVAVVHLDRGGRRFSIEDLEGEEFPTLRVRYPRHRAALALHFFGAVAAYRRLRRRGFDPDVIHAHFFLSALPPLLLRPLFRKPVVVTEQWSVFLPEDPMRLPRVLAIAARTALPRAAVVLPVSEALRRGMEAEGIRARYRVVPNVVDSDLFRPAEPPEPPPFRLLTVSLMYDAKGLDVLLEALAQLRRKRTDVSLELVGDGPLRPELERLSTGLGDAVQFSGLQPKDVVAQRMREAHLFVLASRWDNNPNVLIEALMSGLPAVATRVGGIPEILLDGDGLLAPPGDPVGLADRIDHALTALDSFDRPAIADRARARYGRAAVASSLAQVYAEAIGTAPTRAHQADGLR